MGKNEKNKPKQGTTIHNKEEYDLKCSLNRLNQKRDIRGGTTISEYEPTDSERQSINSTSILSNQGQSTGLFLQMNDSINARYDKLKDDISLVSDKISSSTDSLRLEIETKLNDKVNSTLFYRLFYGAISVIATLSTVIYVFSYSDLVENSNKDNDKIDKTINELQIVKENISNSKIKIDELTNKQFEFEKEILNKQKN